MKKAKYILVFIITILIIISIIVGLLISRNYFISTKNTKKQKLTQTTDENSYVSMKSHLEEVNNSYRKGYEEGKAESNGTIILYFGGKEILASEKVYGSTGVSGTWSSTAYGPYTVIDSIDPKIFSTVRCKGAFWGASASGNSPGVGIDDGSAVISFIDTVTSQTVYTKKVSGRPYDVTIDLSSLNLPNPVKLQYQSWGHMSTWGDPTGQAYLKEVYLKVRDDYQG